MRSAPRHRTQQLVVVTVALAVTMCTDNTSPSRPSPTTPEPPSQQSFIPPRDLATPNPPSVFVGAGDIATCGSNSDEATAALVDSIPGVPVFLLGDNAYQNGAATDYTNCFVPTWGRHKARTHPVPGDRDYKTSGAAGYFNYFGATAGTSGQGYYSYDLGAWHIIALNSEISTKSSSAQMKWLRADLAAHPTLCTLAYWHRPLYSSVSSGSTIITAVRPLWDTLYAYGADLVLNGHRHVYERTAAIKPDGTSDSSFGIRTIVAGTGGIGHGTFTSVIAASEVRDGSTYGVLKLYLYDDSYAWKFIPVAGQTFTDSGSTACHTRPTQLVATSVAFVQQPSNTQAGSSITPAVTVEIRDQFGARLTTATNRVTLAIGTNPGSGALAGTTTVAAVNGVATFTDLSLDKAGTGYTLAASAGGLPGATSSAFDVSAAPPRPTSVAFTVQPSNTVVGGTITPGAQVEILDQYGSRLASATDNITLAIGTNPGGGTLSGTATVAAVAGVATFADLSIDNAGTGYTLAASANGLTGANSSPFDITTAPPVATSLVFAVQPSNTLPGAAITPAVQVEIRDQFGARMTSETTSISLAIRTNPAGGTLGGTTTVAAVAGVATFAGLSIDNAGTGYSLTASGPGLTGAGSSSFDIVAMPPPLPPGMAGCPGSGYTRLVAVSTAAQLASALKTAQPGDQIRLAAGTYSGAMTLTLSGTASQPIVVCALPGTVATLTGARFKNLGSHVRITGLVFAGPNGTDSNVWLAGGDDVQLLGNECRNSSGHSCISGDANSNYRVAYNWIHDNGSGLETDHGIYWRMQAGPGSIDNNVIIASTGRGIAVHDNTLTNPITGVTITQNTVVRCGSTGIQLSTNGGTGNVVANNVVADNGLVYDSKQIRVKPGTNDNTFANNIAWSPVASKNGIDLLTGTVNTVTGNLAQDPMFVSPYSDLHLRDGSPAIGLGIPSYGLSPDFDGITRNATPSAGAYER